MACLVLPVPAMFRSAALLTLASVIALAGCPASSADGVVAFANPTDGANAGRRVGVKIDLANIHRALNLFVLVEEPCLTPGSIATRSASRYGTDVAADTTLELNWTFEAGPHDLCAQLVDLDGRALDAFDAVTFIVDPTASSATAASIRITWPADGSAVTKTFDVALEGKPDPDTAYVVRVDADCAEPGSTAYGDPSIHVGQAGTTKVTLSLETGYHTLCGGIVDKDGNVLPGDSDPIKIYAAY